MAKSRKPRPDKYEKKLAVKGGLGDIIKVAMSKPNATNPKHIKPSKKK